MSLRTNPESPMKAIRRQPVSLLGTRALVLGLGRFGGGLGAARWLLGQGARVTVTDRLPREALAASAAELEAAGAELVFGGHEGLDPARFDLLVVNPAVPLGAPLVQAARAAGTPVTSEMALLLERWPGPVLGVTGSNGKSTTVSLAAALIAGAGQPVCAGGNLGGSLLPELARADERTVAVLELSSFMLEVTGPAGLGPDVAVVTNITPNHLDRHGTLEAYRDAKAAILVRARAAVLPSDDALARDLPRPPGCGRLLFGPPGEGVALAVDPDGHLVGADGARVLDGSRLPFPGRAARLDLAAALLAAEALLGESVPLRATLSRSLAGWRPLPHRLQPVAERGGVRWIDDSVSTTPESTAASLAALAGDCLLIVGGRDKGLSPDALVHAARRHARYVFSIGEQAAALAQRLAAAGVSVDAVGTLAEAVRRAAAAAQPGDRVLLSPGYSSHDQFVHFEARGDAFAALARALPERASAPLSPPAAEC